MQMGPTSSRGRKPQITDLSDPLLLSVFKLLELDDLHSIPATCKHWRALLESPEADSMFKEVKVNMPAAMDADTIRGMYSWFQKHAHAIKTLTVEFNDSMRWIQVHALLAIVGPGLTTLKVYDTTEEVNVDLYKDASWLAFVPNLTSLELYDAFSKYLFDAKLPAHLQHVALSYSSPDNGVPITSVPPCLTHLTELKALTLSTQYADCDFSRLAAMPGLESLDLSDSTLPVLPYHITSLPNLTALRLNNMSGMVANPEGLTSLGKLKSLKLLEMRDCFLTRVPKEAVKLTSLQTLLLGYNEFNDDSPPIPKGPYLKNLEVLAISDTIPDQMSFDEVIVAPLSAAPKLRTLRINRNWGLALTNQGVEELLANKPNFGILEYSEEMATELDIEALQAKFPTVKFLHRD